MTIFSPSLSSLPPPTLGPLHFLKRQGLQVGPWEFWVVYIVHDLIPLPPHEVRSFLELAKPLESSEVVNTRVS